MLSILIILPFCGSIIALFLSPTQARRLAVALSSFLFAVSLQLWVLFDTLDTRYQFTDALPGLGSLGIPLHLGVDGLSLFFILLTTFLTPLCLVLSPVTKHGALFSCVFLFMEALLIGAFSALDLISFYVFFEGVLIPMFILIGIWGSRSRRIRAAYYLFYYTLVGSIFMLLGILYMYSELGTTSAYVLHSHNFTASEQLVL